MSTVYSTDDFITALFCRVDDLLKGTIKYPQAKLHPSELVTIALLQVMKGGSGRYFYRWLTRDYLPLFPNLPDRTRLLRRLATRYVREWADRFLAEPTFFGLIDSYGIELRHPRREGRSKAQIGKKGYSNHRFIVGAKFCPVVNQDGLICDWNYGDANLHDTEFHPLIEKFKDKMHLFGDSGFHKSAKRGGDPENLTICERGQKNERMLIETIFSLFTRILHLKRLGNREWDSLESRLGFAVAAYNVLVGWNGKPNLSIAKLAL